MVLLSAAPVLPYKPIRTQVMNPTLSLEMRGRRSQRTLLQVLTVLNHESTAPKDQITIFRDLLDKGEAAKIAVLELSALGLDELFCP